MGHRRPRRRWPFLAHRPQSIPRRPPSSCPVPRWTRYHGLSSATAVRCHPGAEIRDLQSLACSRGSPESLSGGRGGARRALVRAVFSLRGRWRRPAHAEGLPAGTGRGALLALAWGDVIGAGFALPRDAGLETGAPAPRTALLRHAVRARRFRPEGGVVLPTRHLVWAAGSQARNKLTAANSVRCHPGAEIRDLQSLACSRGSPESLSGGRGGARRALVRAVFSLRGRWRRPAHTEGLPAGTGRGAALALAWGDVIGAGFALPRDAGLETGAPAPRTALLRHAVRARRFRPEGGVVLPTRHLVRAAGSQARKKLTAATSVRCHPGAEIRDLQSLACSRGNPESLSGGRGAALALAWGGRHRRGFRAPARCRSGDRRSSAAHRSAPARRQGPAVPAGGRRCLAYAPPCVGGG